MLLENGADIKLKDGSELGVLHWATLKGLFRYFVNQMKIMISFIGKNNELSGFEEIVKILVEQGADVNLENRNRATALHMTTHNGIC